MENYRRIELVGRGNFGIAVLVQSTINRKYYIMKVIDILKLDKKQRDDALNEVVLLKQMVHPFITTYRESFIDKERFLCIVMDYCEGGDLYHLIIEQKRKGVGFSEDQIKEWFVQICLGLKFIHDKRVLHRDLKTQNIFLTNSSKTIRIGDFGIAKVLQNTCEMAKTAIGTPYYLSPEICKNEPYNQKTDIWSLGCILYELATLRHAFDAKSKFNISLPYFHDHKGDQILEKVPKYQHSKGLVLKILRGIYPGIPEGYSPELTQLIGELLSKKPGARPSIKRILEKPYLADTINKLLNASVETANLQSQRAHSNRPTQEISKDLKPQMPIVGNSNRRNNDLTSNPEDQNLHQQSHQNTNASLSVLSSSPSVTQQQGCVSGNSTSTSISNNSQPSSSILSSASSSAASSRQTSPLLNYLQRQSQQQQQQQSQQVQEAPNSARPPKEPSKLFPRPSRQIVILKDKSPSAAVSSPEKQKQLKVAGIIVNKKSESQQQQTQNYNHISELDQFKQQINSNQITFSNFSDGSLSYNNVNFNINVCQSSQSKQTPIQNQEKELPTSQFSCQILQQQQQQQQFQQQHQVVQQSMREPVIMSRRSHSNSRVTNQNPMMQQPAELNNIKHTRISSLLPQTEIRNGLVATAAAASSNDKNQHMTQNQFFGAVKVNQCSVKPINDQQQQMKCQEEDKPTVLNQRKDKGNEQNMQNQQAFVSKQSTSVSISEKYKQDNKENQPILKSAHHALEKQTQNQNSAVKSSKQTKPVEILTDRSGNSDDAEFEEPEHERLRCEFLIRGDGSKDEKGDSIFNRIEALRVYLEKNLGEDIFYQVYHKLTELSDKDSEEYILESHLQKNQFKFVPLIYQMIFCEDSYFSQ